MIQLVQYRITFQGDDGNITHSAEGMALCEGDPDGESFKRCVASRHYKEGDQRLAYSLEVMDVQPHEQGNKSSRTRKR